jgi:hypothetical protein
MVNPPCLVGSLFPFHLNRTAIKELIDHVTDFLSVLTVCAKGIVLLRKDQIVCVIGLS